MAPRSLRPVGAPDRSVARREADERRRSAAPWRKWYGTAAWRAIRAAQLDAHPLCAMHEARGELVAATVCDHVTPHRGDAGLFFGGPFQSLCAPCHNGLKQRAEAAGRRD